MSKITLTFDPEILSTIVERAVDAALRSSHLVDKTNPASVAQYASAYTIGALYGESDEGR